ncbi:MAG: carotenoid oxygenase family protein, partial [Acidimicrobiia bacterium]
IDPITGEMVVFRYDIEAPFLTWAVVAADGTMAQPETIIDGVDRSFMIHDFAITERFLVLTVAPAVFDIDAMLAGGPMLAWKPELGVRIAVIPRDGVGQIRWFETDPFWVWHYANAYEVDNTIRMDFPQWNAPGFLTPGTLITGQYARAVLDLDAGTIEIEVLQDAMAEFPRIDDRRLGRQHRYVILTAGSGTIALAPGEHDALCRMDIESGTWEQYESGGAIGETVFAPRVGSTGELDGYYLAFVNSVTDDHTSLDIWDAASFPNPPRARIHLPQRVPNGLHGNWFPVA